MTPAQARRRLLTRYAVKATEPLIGGSTAVAMRMRALLSEVAAEIDAGHREAVIEILANSDRNASMPPGGPREALQSIATRCRVELENLDAMKLMGNAVDVPPLPPHITPDPADDPVRFHVDVLHMPGMKYQLWLDCLNPDDLDMMALWIRNRKAKKV